MKKLYFTTSIICLFTLFMGCTKDDTTATDTQLSYSFNAINLNASLSTNATASGAIVAAGTNGSINWTKASINIAKVEFSATQAGKAIALESKNLFFNALKPDSLSGTVSLSSGVYEKNEFKLNINESITNPPLVLTGTYIEASGTRIPVVVQLNMTQLIKLEAPRIEISKGKYVAKVTIELNGLVKGLTASDFGQTTRTAPNNTILVTNTINRPLFEKLALKLPSILSLSMTKQ